MKHFDNIQFTLGKANKLIFFMSGSLNESTVYHHATHQCLLSTTHCILSKRPDIWQNMAFPGVCLELWVRFGGGGVLSRNLKWNKSFVLWSRQNKYNSLQLCKCNWYRNVSQNIYVSMEMQVLRPIQWILYVSPSDWLTDVHSYQRDSMVDGWVYGSDV